MIKPYYEEENIKIYCGDCLNILKEMPDESIDLIITSPPYNVGIDYGVYKDDLDISNYLDWCKEWVMELYRILKVDGRFCLNVIYEVNLHKRGGRIFLASEYWQLLKSAGFKWAGIVDLVEDNPHRVKLTAWGSWMSASAPYLYNPKECILLTYKNQWNKQDKGKSTITKEEFQELVGGLWKYKADIQSLTVASFSLDIPLNALKLFSYENDIVLDPFLGSGTTAIACKGLNRKCIGIEISKEYCDIAIKRIQEIKKEVEK